MYKNIILLRIGSYCSITRDSLSVACLDRLTVKRSLQDLMLNYERINDDAKDDEDDDGDGDHQQ